jgi:acyl-CoA reductase-like NAD-dependent aldehyde dehydrogenase
MATGQVEAGAETLRFVIKRNGDEIGTSARSGADTTAPVESPVPRALAATDHRGVVYRVPYGVALIIGPFNGPLT